ncbi:MAG: efflux RND transporter periplasmic adaptor subunit [Burkholderiaceae bacterium]
MGRVVVRLLIVAIVAGVGLWAYLRFAGPAADQTTFRSTRLETGAISSSVAATGKLSPVVTVQVGSQISGTIAELDADFNSQVSEGQVIARIDADTFKAKVEEAQADVQVAKAALTVQEAALDEGAAEINSARAALTNAEQDLARKRTLLERRIAAQSTVDDAVSVYEQARARLAAARAALGRQRAQVENSRAQVAAREAILHSRELDVRRTTIRSPVDGVVISRNVDVGQTVAASLQAPVLFQIARDLRAMQVEANIDEADIGRIAEGQPVSFTVDAFPARNFRGTVNQIRKAPTEVQNVITYTVIIAADNADLALLPGMTANVTVVVGERRNVVRVPNAALRYTPPGVAVADAATVPSGEAAGFGAGQGGAANGGGQAAGRARLEAIMTRMTEQLGLSDDQQQRLREILIEQGMKLRALRQADTPPDELRAQAQALRAQSRPQIEALLNDEQKARYRAMAAERAANPTTQGRVWVVGEDGEPREVKVVVGLTDGSVSELVGGDLKAGDAVIVGVERGAQQTARRPLGF